MKIMLVAILLPASIEGGKTGQLHKNVELQDLIHNSI